MHAESWREVWKAFPLYLRVLMLILTFILLPLFVALTLYYYGFEGFLKPGFLGAMSGYLAALGSNIGSVSSRLGLKKQKYFAYTLICIAGALFTLALLRWLGLL